MWRVFFPIYINQPLGQSTPKLPYGEPLVWEISRVVNYIFLLFLSPLLSPPSSISAFVSAHPSGLRRMPPSPRHFSNVPATPWGSSCRNAASRQRRPSCLWATDREQAFLHARKITKLSPFCTCTYKSAIKRYKASRVGAQSILHVDLLYPFNLFIFMLNRVPSFCQSTSLHLMQLQIDRPVLATSKLHRAACKRAPWWIVEGQPLHALNSFAHDDNHLYL